MENALTLLQFPLAEGYFTSVKGGPSMAFILNIGTRHSVQFSYYCFLKEPALNFVNNNDEKDFLQQVEELKMKMWDELKFFPLNAW